MANQDKILFVARTMPFPVRGGDLIVLENIMKALSKSNIEADLLCFTRSNKDISNIQNVKKRFGFKNVFYSQIKPKINLSCIFDWIFKKKSYIFNRFYSEKLSEKLLNLVKSGEYSTIVFEHTFMYVNVFYNPVLKKEIKKRNIKTIINSHVLEYFVLSQAYEKEKTGFKKFFIKNELDFIKEIELSCIKDANKTIFLGKEEIDRIKNILPDEADKFQLFEMKPFIDSYPYSSPEFEEKNSVYFLGTFSWKQNHDAVMYFVREIFPLILQKNLDIKFYLVGMNAGKDIKAIHDGKNIFFIGEKENIFEEIKKYSVLVVPLRLKGGTRIKILESLSWGKAIVSTSAGMEGVNTYGENPVLIADNPEEFAQKVLELLEDESLKIQIKENARDFAEKYYSFEKFQQAVLKELFSYQLLKLDYN